MKGTLSIVIQAAVLASAVTLLRLRVDGALWEIVAKGATGILMLVFALRGLLRLAAG